MRFFYFSFLIGALAISGFAQDAFVATPALGFAFDANLGAIRAIRGIPGAALVADAVASDSKFQSAAIAPGRAFALVTSADSPLRLLRLETGATQTLDGALSSPARIVFSPSGDAALLFQDSGRLQVVTGLPGSPSVQDWNLPALDTAPAAMAIADGGTMAVLSSGGADADPVWLVTSAGALELPLPGSVAAAFRSNSADLLAVAAGGDLYLVRNLGANAVYRVLRAGDVASSRPFAVRFSRDGSRAYTANADGVLASVDVESGSVSSVSCGCRAAALDPLNGRDLFRVTAGSSSPVMLFDAGGTDPRVWFVPGAASGDSEGAVR